MPPLASVAAMAEIWFRHAPHITFHDPLAAALIFEPSLCETKAALVEVDLVNLSTVGHTNPVYTQETKPHELAAAVNSQAFFNHYFAVVGT